VLPRPTFWGVQFWTPRLQRRALLFAVVAGFSPTALRRVAMTTSAATSCVSAATAATRSQVQTGSRGLSPLFLCRLRGELFVYNSGKGKKHQGAAQRQKKERKKRKKKEKKKEGTRKEAGHKQEILKGKQRIKKKKATTTPTNKATTAASKQDSRNKEKLKARKQERKKARKQKARKKNRR